MTIFSVFFLMVIKNISLLGYLLINRIKIAVAPPLKRHTFTPLEKNDIVVCARALYDHYDNLLAPISLEYENQKEILGNAFDALIQTTISNRDRYHDFLDPTSPKVTEDLQILDQVETQRKFQHVEQVAQESILASYLARSCNL